MKVVRLSAIGCGLVLLSGLSYGTVFEFSGKAQGRNGELLYTEQHRIRGECDQGTFRPREHRVRYEQPDAGNQFADKALSYNLSPTQPEVVFNQPRFKESLRISYPDNEEIEIDWETPMGETRAFELPLSDRVVVDAGFDNLVRQNWSRLQAGQKVEFRFLGPTRGEHYGFVLEPTDDPEVEADLEVAIRPTSLFLQLMVDPIVLGYNRQGALTDYLGLTNIRQNKDSNYQAHIRYDVAGYPDCELTP